MTIAGALTDDGASAVVIVGPGETLTVALEVAEAEAFEGIVAVEESANEQTWTPAVDVLGNTLRYVGTDAVELDGEIVTTTIKNATTGKMRYRVAVYGVEQDGVSYSLANVVGDVLYVVLADKNGKPLASVRDDGGLVFHGPLVLGNGVNLVHLESEETVSTGAVAATVSLDTYTTKVITGDTDGNEELVLGDAAAAIVGQRKLIILETRTGTDVVTLDEANIVDVDGAALSAVALDAAGEFILVESNGAAWQVVYHDATVTPA